MKKLLIISTVALLTTGCVTTEIKTATAPISQSRANMVVDGTTTKLDIISMFGSPNGSSGFGAGMPMGMPQQAIMQGGSLGNSELMSYKDCVTSSIASAQVLSFENKGRGRETCKVFTALLDKNDVVIAHKYTNDNFITKEKILPIVAGKSTKKDVIKTLAGPTKVTQIKDKTLYLYKTCITKSKAGGFFNYNISSDQDCQQATIVIDKKTNIVSKVNFLPFMSGYNENESAVMMSH